MGKDSRLMNNRRNVIIAALLAALVGFGVVALLLRDRGEQQQPAAQDAVAEQNAAAEPTAEPSRRGRPRRTPSTPTPPQAAPKPTADEPLTFRGAEARVHGEDPGGPRNSETLVNVTIRLTLAALLSAMLAFRPRRLSHTVKRNPFVAQTQILMAVVASALMMVVGDSAARAFGIFAAASLVRFRTNIKDPKEITVLLVSLAIGLATGVGRWELGLI